MVPMVQSQPASRRIHSIVNLDEKIGRWVGRRHAPDPLALRPGKVEDARAWHRAMGGSGIPKGLYRFNTHEEADQWLWKMITRRKKI